jgi:rhodanese-related sulfurtransferase
MCSQLPCDEPFVRIAPLELKQRLESGETITIVDLRNAFEWREGRIPGSLTLTDKELDAFVPTAPEAELILYCSCPTRFPVRLPPQYDSSEGASN